MKFFSSRPATDSASSRPVVPAGGRGAPTLVKVALLGDAQVGKTSLMVRYVEGAFDETQLHTQGVPLNVRDNDGRQPMHLIDERPPEPRSNHGTALVAVQTPLHP